MGISKNILLEKIVSTYNGTTYTREVRFSFSQSEVASDNKSLLSWRLYIKAGSPGKISSTQSTASIAINGKTLHSADNNLSINVNDNAETTIFSDVTEIKHNTNGTASFTYDISVKINVPSIQSGTLTSGSKTTTKNGTETLTAITSPSSVLKSIQNSSGQTLSSINLGDTIRVVYTPVSSAYYHKLEFYMGSTTIWKEDVDAKSTSSGSNKIYSYTVSKSDWSSSLNGSSGTLNVRLRTFSSSDLSSDSRVGIDGPLSVAVSLPSSDLNPTVSLTVQSGTKYSDETKFLITPTVTSSIGAAISSINIQLLDGSTVLQEETGVNGGVTVFNEIPWNSSWTGTTRTITAKVTAKDNKGHTGTGTLSITLNKYYLRVNNFKVYRCTSAGVTDPQGEYIRASGTVEFSVAASNVTLKLEIKTESASTWSPWVSYTVSSSPVNLKQDASSYYKKIDDVNHYKIRLIAIDNISGTTDSPAVLAIQGMTPTYALMEFYHDGTGISFGKMATKSNTADFGMVIENTHHGIAFKAINNGYEIGLGVGETSAVDQRGIFDAPGISGKGMNAFGISWDNENKLRLRGDKISFFYNRNPEDKNAVLAYTPGTEISYGNKACFSGYYDSTNTTVNFFVPCNGQVLANVAAVEGQVRMAGINGIIATSSTVRYVNLTGSNVFVSQNGIQISKSVSGFTGLPSTNFTPVTVTTMISDTSTPNGYLKITFSENDIEFDTNNRTLYISNNDTAPSWNSTSRTLTFS